MSTSMGGTTAQTNIHPLRQELSALEPWMTSILGSQHSRTSPVGSPPQGTEPGQGVPESASGPPRQDTARFGASLSMEPKPRPYYIQPVFARAWAEGWSEAKDDRELIDSIATFIKASSPLYGLNVSDGELRVAKGHMASRDPQRIRRGSFVATSMTGAGDHGAKTDPPRVRRGSNRVASIVGARDYAETAWRCLFKTDEVCTDEIKDILADARADYWRYHQEHVAKGSITLSGYLTAKAWHAYFGGSLLGHLRELQAGLVLMGEATSWLKGTSMFGHCVEVMGDSLRKPRRICSNENAYKEPLEASIDREASETDSSTHEEEALSERAVLPS